MGDSGPGGRCGSWSLDPMSKSYDAWLHCHWPLVARGGRDEFFLEREPGHPGPGKLAVTNDELTTRSLQD